MKISYENVRLLRDWIGGYSFRDRIDDPIGYITPFKKIEKVYPEDQIYCIVQRPFCVDLDRYVLCWGEYHVETDINAYDSNMLAVDLDYKPIIFSGKEIVEVLKILAFPHRKLLSRKKQEFLSSFRSYNIDPYKGMPLYKPEVRLYYANRLV